MSYRAVTRVTEAIEKNFGLRFCTQCHLTRASEGGKVFSLSTGRTRWKCATCVAKATPSGLGKKK
jgi:hypothetical protein